MKSGNSTPSLTTRSTGFVRSIPAFIWVITSLHVALLLLGSVIQPLFRVSDERFHADMIVAVSQESGWPPVRGRRIGPEIEIATRLIRRDPKLASNAIPRAVTQRVNEEEICTGVPVPTCLFRPELNAFSNWMVEGYVNRMTQHPPLYYVAVSTVGHGVQALFPPAYDLAFDQELWLYRLVTLLMVGPLPLLTFVLTRHITEDAVVQFSATSVVLVVMGLHLRNGAMINNDNLLLLLGGLLLISFIRIAKGDTTRKTAVMTGLLLGLSLITKGFALVLVPTLLAGYVLAYLETRSVGLRSLLRSALISLSVAGLTGGWWWVRNLLHYGSLQPGGAGVGEPAGPGFKPEVWHWLTTAISDSIKTFFGGDTFRRVEAGPLLFWAWVAFFAVGIVSTLLLARDRRRYVGLMLLPIVLIAGGIMLNSYRFYSNTAEVRGVNGRYFYFLLPGLLIILSYGYVLALKRVRPLKGHLTFERFVPFSFLIAAAAFQAYGVLRRMELEWGPPVASFSGRWEALNAWSPLPEPWVAIFVTLTILLFVAATILGLKFALSDSPLPSIGEAEVSINDGVDSSR
jgi:small subunit ribosomal protein S36